jgi:hypothetical protein
LSVDVDNGGETIRKSLSGTCLGNTNDITTGKGHGPTLRLNGSRGREALGLDLIHDISGETSLVESLDGSWNILASDGHLVLAAEGFHISIRSVCDIGVFLVERLLELGEGADIPLLVLEASAEGTHTVTAGTSSIAASETTTSETAAAAAVTISVTVSITSASVATTAVTIAVTTSVTTTVAAITAVTTTAVATSSAATAAAVSAVVARHYFR